MLRSGTVSTKSTATRIARGIRNVTATETKIRERDPGLESEVVGGQRRRVAVKVIKVPESHE